MALDSVAGTSATTSSNSTLGIQDFLKILSTQLSYQDPLKPMDNQEFLAQMAQFTNLQQTQQMSAKMDQMLANQVATQGVSLLGRTVEVTTSSGTTTGVVSKLSLSGSSPSLTVTPTSGAALSNISLSQISAVH
jgi:flagellar basal-body rod modification protein FlgD